MSCALMSVLVSSSRVRMHDPQHGGLRGCWVSSWVLFFVTVRPRCLSWSSLSAALGVVPVGAGLSYHLRCGVLELSSSRSGAHLNHCYLFFGRLNELA